MHKTNAAIVYSQYIYKFKKKKETAHIILISYEKKDIKGNFHLLLHNLKYCITCKCPSALFVGLGAKSYIIAHGNPLIQDDSRPFQVSEPLDYPNRKYVSGGVRLSEVLL